MQSGGCQCGSVRYQVEGVIERNSLCHCHDCQASSGAPMVAWTAVPERQFQLLEGEPTLYEGRDGARREFCPQCGTGLFYRNAVSLPGIVDIQTVTFDAADQLQPTAQVQCADRLEWIEKLGTLPAFDRYPG